MPSLSERFLTVFGDIKIFSYPFWVVYDPGAYKVRGAEMRSISNLLLPGDVLLRKYDGYLDGRFIPGFFSHVGMYLGPVEPTENPGEGDPRVSRSFADGPFMLAHSMAEGVFLDDVLNFLRCDYIGVLRLPATVKAVPGAQIPSAEERATWAPEEQALCAALLAGEEIARERIVEVARGQALGLLGTAYDFAFDFKDGHRLSCSEFVARCLRCAGPFLGLVPKPRSVLGGLAVRMLVEPDAFLGSPLDFPYASPQGHEAMRKKRVRLPANVEPKTP